MKIRQNSPNCLAAAGLALVGMAAFAQTQSWNCKAWLKDPLSGQCSKERCLLATVSPVAPEGKASFRITTPGRGEPCS